MNFYLRISNYFINQLYIYNISLIEHARVEKDKFILSVPFATKIAKYFNYIICNGLVSSSSKVHAKPGKLVHTGFCKGTDIVSLPENF